MGKKLTWVGTFLVFFSIFSAVFVSQKQSAFGWTFLEARCDANGQVVGKIEVPNDFQGTFQVIVEQRIPVNTWTKVGQVDVNGGGIKNFGPITLSGILPNADKLRVRESVDNVVAEFGVCVSPTATPTRKSTATSTATRTATSTSTKTATSTATVTKTPTFTSTPVTPTVTRTSTPVGVTVTSTSVVVTSTPVRLTSSTATPVVKLPNTGSGEDQNGHKFDRRRGVFIAGLGLGLFLLCVGLLGLNFTKVKPAG